jgi:pimeloyl-ACP methyl ester carboxylesterase
MSAHWIPIPGRDAALEALDFGGSGPGALLLHGLAGTAPEWEETAGWLMDTHRVVALDQRGHGRSERHPRDVSRAAFVEDAVAAIEQLGLAPVVLLGQSLGGHTALLLAARRPELVRALIVVEASPAEAEADAPARVRQLLSTWPIPFPSLEAAQAFFGGGTLAGRIWATSLEARDGGLWPAFEVDVMVATLEEATGAGYWDEWRSISAPILVVRAENGDLSAGEAEEMIATSAEATLVSVAGAGHDVHLDAPEAWRTAVEAFLSGLS